MTDTVNAPVVAPVTDPATATAPVAPASFESPRFIAVVTAFATTLGLSYGEVRDNLKATAIDKCDDASLGILADPNSCTNDFYASIFPSVKRPMLNSAVNALRAAVAPVKETPVGTGALPGAPMGFPGFNTAGAGPMVPLTPLGDDQSFMAQLVTGGRLNGSVTPVDAASVARVAMASGIRIFDIPRILVNRIEAVAEEQEMPSDASVFELIDSITLRDHAELFRALGVPARAASADARKKLLDRVQTYFLPGIRRFHATLTGWYEGYKAERADPTLLLTALTGGMGGMVPVVTTDTSVIRSAAADLMTMTNKLFAGPTAIVSARAMAADITRILGMLNDPKYVHAAGYTTRDEMLRGLGCAVTEQYARNERTLATYVMNAMNVPSVSDQQLPYFAQQLYILGASLDWEAVGTPKASESPSAPATSVRRAGTAKFSPYP